jgi:hypothetical protein
MVLELIVVRGNSEPEYTAISGADELDSALTEIIFSYPHDGAEAWTIALRLPDGDIKGILLTPEFVHKIEQELAAAI